MAKTRAEPKTCFVISSFNARANDVYERYIKHVCEIMGYNPIRSDHQLTKNILDGIKTSLHNAPMVIAYLGPPTSENVLVELGYRLATGQPLVMLCDAPPEGQSPNLPFDISHDRVVLLPRGDSPTMTAYSDIARLMEKYALETVPIDSNQAVALLDLPPTRGLDPEQAVYIGASRLATSLFGIDGALVGRTLAQFMADRQQDMPPYQYRAFDYDQQLLVAYANGGARRPIVARIPIVLNRGTYAGRAYLPIIVNCVNDGYVYQLRTLYLDVTSVVTFTRDPNTEEMCYRCRLNPLVKAIPAVVQESQRSDRGVGVFLAHRSADKEAYVRPVYDLLKEHGGAPWLDVESIPPGDWWPGTIAKALQLCRAAMVFVNASAFGSFQELEIADLITEFARRKSSGDSMRIVPVLLPGSDPNCLRGHFLDQFQAVAYEKVLRGDFVHDFVAQLFAEEEHAPVCTLSAGHG